MQKCCSDTALTASYAACSPYPRYFYLQAPVFLGAQLHSLRALVNFALQMGRNVGAQTRLAAKIIKPKCDPDLTICQF
jgi:hypothetical protein